jgi:hypothetical protein
MTAILLIILLPFAAWLATVVGLFLYYKRRHCLTPLA